MERIRQEASRRRAEEEPYFPAFKEEVPPSRSAEVVSKELAYELQEAYYHHDRAWVSAQPQPTRVPLLGRVLARLKGELHDLIVFYVNSLAAKQTSFNAHSVRATARLAEATAAKASQTEVEALRREVEELREKVARLEAELGRRCRSSPGSSNVE